MAVKVNPEVETPASTGAVRYDGGPYTVEQTADNTSTGAVEMPGPVTVTASWPVETKVIAPPAKAKVAPAKVAEVK